MTREEAAKKYATTTVKGPKEWEQFDSRKYKHFIDGAEWQLKEMTNEEIQKAHLKLQHAITKLPPTGRNINLRFVLWLKIKIWFKRMFSKK